MAGQLWATEKSPVTVMLEIVTLASPVLVKVKTCPMEELPIVTEPKEPVVGVSLAEATGAGMLK